MKSLKNENTRHFFYSYPPITTITSAYNSTAVSELASYSLCSEALADYNITSNDLPDEAYDDSDWYAEYQRVCLVNPDALPTVGFNTSITLSTTASAGATGTASSATATSTAFSVSPDGTCGAGTGYTCAGSEFGDCCSIYGDWYVGFPFCPNSRPIRGNLYN